MTERLKANLFHASEVLEKHASAFIRDTIWEKLVELGLVLDDPSDD